MQFRILIDFLLASSTFDSFFNFLILLWVKHNNFKKIRIILDRIEEAKERTKFFQSIEMSDILFIYTDWICELVKKNALKVKFIGNVNNNNPNLMINKL